MIEVELKKWGNSTGVIIPKEVLDSIGVEQGERVEINVKKRKFIDGFGLFKGMPSFERDHRILDRDFD